MLFIDCLKVVIILYLMSKSCVMRWSVVNCVFYFFLIYEFKFYIYSFLKLLVYFGGKKDGVM